MRRGEGTQEKERSRVETIGAHGQFMNQSQFQTKLPEAPKEMKTPKAMCLLHHEAVYSTFLLLNVLPLNYGIEPGSSSSPGTEGGSKSFCFMVSGISIGKPHLPTGLGAQCTGLSRSVKAPQETLLTRRQQGCHAPFRNSSNTMRVRSKKANQKETKAQTAT